MIDFDSRKKCIRWAFWFSLFNALLAMVIGTLYLKAANLPADFLAQSFLAVSFPAHFVSLSFLSLPLIMIVSVICPDRRLVMTLGLFYGSLLLIVLLIDAGVYSLYRFHLNGMVWNLIKSGVATEVLSLTWITWLTFFAAVSVLLAIQSVIAMFLWRHVDRLRFGLQLFVLLLVLILGSHFFHAWADFVHYVPITRTVRTLPAFKPVTMKRIMQKLGFKPVKKSQGIQAVDGGSGLQYPREDLNYANSPRPLNLLMIVIDSWRYDMLTPETTPNIWRLASDSWVFNQHFSASNCTRFGIFSLFYGLYGTYWHSFLAEQRGPVLIGELKKRGYEMGLFASAPLSNPEFDRTVFVDVRDTLQIRQEGERALDRDLQITRKMKRFIDERATKRPFFGFLFYDTPHSKQFPENFGVFKPYVDSVNYMALDRDLDPQPIVNSYKNALRFVDSNVGEIMTALEKRGELNSTVVVITGDHGEEFNDLKLGYWGHNGNFAKFQTQTPLLLHFPGATGRTFSHTTTSLDVVPTLMKEMFGAVTDPAGYSNGTYLTDSRQRSFVHVSTWDSFALVDDKRICIVENKGGTEVVDCNYRELPGETMNPLVSKEAMEGMSRFYQH